MKRFLVILTWIGIALTGLGIFITGWAVMSVNSGISYFPVGWVPYMVGTILALTGSNIGRVRYIWPILTIFGIIYCMFFISAVILTGGEQDSFQILIVFFYTMPGLANIICGLIISQLKEKRKKRLLKTFNFIFSKQRSD